MPACAIVSFRLGSHDGVSITARIWQQILREIGFDTYTVAGDGDVDYLLPELAAYADDEPSIKDLQTVLSQSQLTLVENMASIPLNLPATRALLSVLRGQQAIMHHHDTAWQRAHLGHIAELPAHDPAWQHVVINDFTKRQMLARGFKATRIYNPFDTDPSPGDRQAARGKLGVADDELLVTHPVRAIQRKNILGAIALAEKLDGTYWLVGPAEDGYGPTLEAILESAACRVIHGRGEITETPVAETSPMSASDIYAASDVVVYPSWWEGFGNPPVESAIHRKPAIVSDYPAAEELRDLGFQWAYPWETRAMKAFLEDPAPELLEKNFQIADRHLSIEAIKPQITQLLQNMGWKL